MELLAYAFWVANALISFGSIYVWSKRWNAYGSWGLAMPAGWAWIWQAFGVGLVALFRWSPWHLAWWFPAGLVVCVTIGRILYRLDVIRFKSAAPERFGSNEQEHFNAAYERRIALNVAVNALYWGIFPLALAGVVGLVSGRIPEGLGGLVLAGVSFTCWSTLHNWALMNPREYDRHDQRAEQPSGADTATEAATVETTTEELVECHNCGRKNRVPAGKPKALAVCGGCREKLFLM